MRPLFSFSQILSLQQLSAGQDDPSTLQISSSPTDCSTFTPTVITITIKTSTHSIPLCKTIKTFAETRSYQAVLNCPIIFQFHSNLLCAVKALLRMIYAYHMLRNSNLHSSRKSSEVFKCKLSEKTVFMPRARQTYQMSELKYPAK